jgi:branched-chain amino acid transport system permease protein
MDNFLHVTLSILVNTLVQAAVYAPTALAFALVYRLTKVVNFAVGEFVALGGYFLLIAIADWGLAPYFAVPVALLLSVGLSLVVYVVLLRPMLGRPEYSVVIATMGLAIAIDGLIPIIWGVGPHSAPVVRGQVFELPFRTLLSSADALAVLGSAVGLLVMWMVVRYLRIGTLMRAAADSPLLASQMGVNVYFVFAVAWCLAGLITGLAGVTYSNSTLVSPNLIVVALRALPGAMVGGLDSLPGAVVGSLLVAFLQTIVTTLGDPNAADVVAFALLLVVFAWRPYGIFGIRPALRV